MPKKGGLGKGLESLMADANIELNRVADDHVLDIDVLIPNPNQPRKEFDGQALAELADSIKQNGVLQPLLVRKKGKKYEIVAGERRYQASKIAGIRELPVVVKEISDDEVFKLALIENLQRADLNPIEEAEGFRQLLEEKDITQEQLGKILSKSRSTITNTLRLLDLPEEVQAFMADGKLTAGHARAILAVPSAEGRIKLAERVISERLSVRQTEALAPLFSGIGEERPTRTATPQSFKRVARQLRIALDTNVRVKKVRGKNKIEIDFKDEEDLARIVGSIADARKAMRNDE